MMPGSQTLNAPFTLTGPGLHTGAPARVTVGPRDGGGLVFRSGGVEIPALAEYVTDTRRCTTLGRDGASVRTVEHLLAALWLAEIDHAEIAVDGPELPALDGAAGQWFAAVQAAGARRLDTAAPVYRIAEPAWVREGDSEFFLCPAEGAALYAAISFAETPAAQMLAGGALTDATRSRIVAARTFALEREVEALRAAGLAQGGSLETVVVLTRDGYLNDDVQPNEPAWHKVLDLAGDLALIGARLHGQVLAVRGGHAGHVALARKIREMMR